jgi:hypothetical protein
MIPKSSSLSFFLGATFACALFASGCSKASAAEDKASGGAAPAASGPTSAKPLQNWMKANASTALNEGNFEKLASVFDRLGKFAPEGEAEFQSWGTIATKGGQAASAKDLAGVRAACKECHDTQRSPYKARFANRPLPVAGR